MLNYLWREAGGALIDGLGVGIFFLLGIGVATQAWGAVALGVALGAAPVLILLGLWKFWTRSSGIRTTGVR
jgi:hypothetical protein